MKLRIKGNSIRLRLSRTDVNLFENERSIIETTHFANNNFTYSLSIDSSILKPTAELNNFSIEIKVPESEGLAWAKSQEVGIYEKISLPHGKHLSITIEKDFKCLDETSEDQSDNFENPLSAK